MPVFAAEDKIEMWNENNRMHCVYCQNVNKEYITQL